MKTRTFAVLLTLLLPGCYHYVPEAGRTLARGTPIRVILNRPQSFELSSVTVNSVGIVTAEMIREADGAVFLSARWLDALTGQGFPGQGWTFRIPREDIGTLEVRTLSRWRTAAVVAGGFLATWLGFEALHGSVAGSGGSGGGTVPR